MVMEMMINCDETDRRIKVEEEDEIGKKKRKKKAKKVDKNVNSS